MKKVLVLGYGVSGKASAALLREQGAFVTAMDQDPGPGVLADSMEIALDEYSQVILSPGVSPAHPIVKKASALSIEVIGEMELAFRSLKNRAVGVTGTNGKTTVTLLVEHVLNASGVKAKAVGNIGMALSQYLLAPNLAEVLVIELSSFQLETLQSKKLMASVYLNLTPDHLDRYPSMRAYAAAKANIQNCSETLFVSQQVAADYGTLFKPGFKILAAGSTDNVEAAFALCQELGIGKEPFLEALKTFQKPHHRIERIGSCKGVQYINDSKGTNVDAVIYAIDEMRQEHRPVVLIVGGVDKGASYQPWVEKFQGIVKKVIAYGQAASKIELELAPFFSFEKVASFGDAFNVAAHEARAGDVVLLSPGCSSFDQFQNYEQRGNEFRNRFESLQQES